MSDLTPMEIVWRPTPEVAARARIGRFMAEHGFASLDALHRRSIEDPEWFWDAVARDIGLTWIAPYRRVLDESRGIPWPRWFEGGLLNLAANCVDRHLAERRDRPALIHEPETGESRTLTFGELAREVNHLAHALRGLGVGEGDRVGIFLPIGIEAAVAALAVVRIGAIFTPCFSGYGAQAVASRLNDCEAKVLITADGFHRRGQLVRMKQTADEATDLSPSVRHVLVVRRLAVEVPWTPGRDRWWHEAVAGQPDECPPVAVEADRPCLIIYTSGTTGRPKGAVLTHGGFAL
jgi:acetyl-CoA synthetase